MKKILAFLFLALCFCLPAHAEKFVILDYDMLLNIREDNTVSINEYIKTYFNSPAHGIFRSIPIVNNVARADGTTEKINAKISNFSSSEPIRSTNLSGGEYVAQVGRENVYVSGDKDYSFSYDYKIYGNSSEFYFNIIGTGWNTDIKKVTFKVKMPKEFDYSKVGLSVGAYGTIGFEGDVIYSIDKKTNTITGRTTRALKPHEAITLRIELPKDYFIQKENPAKNVCIFIVLILTLTSFLMWYKIGKDDRSIPVVNFYPPRKLNSAQIGVAYDGKAAINHVVSLILYLASKGYLKIREIYGSFSLEKIKNYEGKNKECRDLMNALFGFNGKTKVSEDELNVSKLFYKQCEDIVKNLNDISKMFFEKESISLWAKIIPALSILISGIIFFYVCQDYEFISSQIPPLIYLFPTFAVFMLCKVTKDSLKAIKRSEFKKLRAFGGFFEIGFILFWAAFFGGVPMLFIVDTLSYPIKQNMPVLIVALFGIIVSAVCLYQMPKRNKQGAKILGEIIGFKKFLETAEESRIRMLCEKDSTYCFDILPYAYVLGVYEGWIKKLENVVSYKPDWWSGDMDYHSFYSVVNSIGAVASPSVSNGGIAVSSGGGGGFSGGGCGGGGGGSW